jgi:serine phosphatase RsbU (regulator of sigma subunit)
MILHLTENSTETMRSQIARQLRSKILTGDLREGCALPEIHRVARQHRVNPHDVRHALDELAGEGLLQRDGDTAFRVAVMTPEQRRVLAERHLLDAMHGKELSVRELEAAREVQRRLLPPARVEGERFAVVSRSFPARVVAGDFHDVLNHADGSVGIVVADVAGKGFGASLIMASVKAMAPFIAAERGVADTLCELNRRLCSELGRGQFVALAYARIVPRTGAVDLANAGMPDPFFVGPHGPVRALEVPGPRLPLGIRADVRYESVADSLDEGSRLLLFSDGIPEARRPTGEPLGYDGLAGTLVRSVARTPGPLALESWLDGVLDEVQRATGPALEDDWTAVVVECGRGGEERWICSST